MKRKTRRNSRGQYRTSWRNRLLPLVFLIVSILLGLFIQSYFSEQELKSPCEGGCSFFMVRAVEKIEPETVEVAETVVLSEKEQIIQYITEVFGKDAPDAIKIMQCESRGNPETVGDTHIMSYDHKWGEMVGDSIGLFQIRVGGEGWNRARANSMSADEFRKWLRVPNNNIKYAKTIFDKRGWSAWWNCMNKVL